MSQAATSCRSCGARIWWATTTAGKAMPIDDGPADDGNLAVSRDRLGRLTARALVLDEEPEGHEHRARSHFSTCPNADAHRRRDR